LLVNISQLTVLYTRFDKYLKKMSEKDLRRLIRLIVEREAVSKLHPHKKGEFVDTSSKGKIGKRTTADVVDMIRQTYGSWPGADSEETVPQRFSDYFLTDVDPDPEPDAGILYTKRGSSKKASGIVTDGNLESRQAIRKMMDVFLRKPGAWIEVSGAPAKIAIVRLGLPVVEDEETVRALLSSVGDVVWHGENPAGLQYGRGWYSRKIQGQSEEKIIVGNPPK